MQWLLPLGEEVFANNPCRSTSKPGHPKIRFSPALRSKQTIHGFGELLHRQEQNDSPKSVRSRARRDVTAHSWREPHLISGARGGGRAGEDLQESRREHPHTGPTTNPLPELGRLLCKCKRLQITSYLI